jgi:hypothetical protein
MPLRHCEDWSNDELYENGYEAVTGGVGGVAELKWFWLARDAETLLW